MTHIGRIIGKHIGTSIGLGSAGGPPVIISDGNSVGWYIADDLTTITKDGADRVSDWADKLGSGHDLVQLTGADQPLWSATGVLFDGVSEFMKTAAFTFEQPEIVYMVVKHITWTSTRHLIDGNIIDSTVLGQYGVTPQLDIYAGSLIGANDGNLALNTYGIVRVLLNGATSFLQINENASTIADAGTNDSGGFTLGAKADGSLWSNIEVQEIILRKTADSTGDQQIIYDYLANKYGI